MGLAALISGQCPTGEFRHMIHDEVDKWVDRIIDEVFVDGKESAVMELSQLFSKTKCLEFVVRYIMDSKERFRRYRRFLYEKAAKVDHQIHEKTLNKERKRDFKLSKEFYEVIL